MTNSRVLQIDHVEVLVPDRHAAADWYERTLGLRVVPEYQHWSNDPKGPLMISSDGGSTKLALFEGQPQAGQSITGWQRVAFRIDAIGFIEFIERLEDLRLTDIAGQSVTCDSVVDHEQAYSIYFCDPYGNALEVTTYEHETTRVRLADRQT
jgi:catechol 2,3-dioxygenase-like lactoylglutathione lyase family enzyme